MLSTDGIVSLGTSLANTWYVLHCLRDKYKLAKNPWRLTAKKNEDQKLLSERQEIWGMKADFTSTASHYITITNTFTS